MVEVIFKDERRYGDYRGPNMCRSEVIIELDNDEINVFVEDGDVGGRGAEQQSANHTMSFESARQLVEALHPVLYGERE